MTLIELLIYLAIISMIFISLISLAYNLIANQNILGKEIVADEEADFVIHKIDSLLNDNLDNIKKFQLVNSHVTFGDEILNSDRVQVENFQIIKTADDIQTSFRINGRSFSAIKYLP